MNIKEFVKKELTLCISFLLVILSAFASPPSYAYIESIDFRVISLLFCLMATVSGFRQTGIFERTANYFLSKVKTEKSVMLVLVMLCFFSSMLITNDVALITFVPFAITILTKANMRKKLRFVIIMQTIAANLGSMIMPIGNPQNLYLYSLLNTDIIGFMRITFPYWLVSFIAVCIVTVIFGKGNIERPSSDETLKKDTKKEIFYFILFFLCILTVAHLIDYRITFLICIISIAIFDKSILKMIDYCLLLTLVCFFIFVGNISVIAPVREFIASVSNGHEILTSAALSQIISNVPAAILLSGFTEKYASLIIGVNIGGLGTLIASLASLISYKFYAAEEKDKRYILEFTLLNVLFLIILGITYLLLYAKSTLPV
ncbi:MAG: anion permease [Firmicutes bacterium]|nr:anion permease [Bacillota bacterium]